MYYDLSNSYDCEKAKVKLQTMINQKAIIQITKKQKKKSVSNNAYLHVCISLFAIEFGYTLEEAKTLLKRKCEFMTYDKNGTKFLKLVRKLDDKECADFTTWIRNYSSSNGCYIPTPEEYILNQTNIDKHIYNNKEYL